jgi:thiol-disulfide isomerase/thioredoxin
MDVSRMMLFAVGAVSLVNLVLVLRVIARMRAMDRPHEDHSFGGDPLAIGAEAPPFNALTLAGQGITDARLAGRPVAYLFVSPSCDHCRDLLPMVDELGALAARAARVQLVLVADVGPTRVRSWLETVAEEDGVKVAMPVLAAPLSRSTMTVDYNPPGMLPYFCLVDEAGLVVDRGTAGGAEWNGLVEMWRSADAVRV